ncbi:hypothetical protein H0H87_000499 [Tephrocybe sp. NHM501043]|nr:hypothetical protein H0H87_000499 [Tephrocybe sp. NHM501043]
MLFWPPWSLLHTSLVLTAQKVAFAITGARNLKVPLRSHTVPLEMHEKAAPLPVIELQPETKRRWNWRRFTVERPTRISSPRRPSTSPAPISKKAPSGPRIVASPWSDTFEPTHPLSTIITSDPRDLQLAPIISHGSVVSADDDFLPNPKPSRGKSVNKLARTLGVEAENVARNSLGPGQASSSRHELARSRRQSLSLTTTFNTVPAFLRQTPRTLPKRSQSRISLSTLNTDDIHRFSLGDDLSDNWGEFRTGSRSSLYSSYSPISPIVFNPPSPATTKPPQRLPSADNVKLEDVTFASNPHLDATLSRSRSMSFALLRPKIGRLAHLASAHALEAETRPVSVTTPLLPVKAGWLESTPAESQKEESRARSFVVSHPEYVDEYRNWSGQWNQDNVQDVIKMLRTLK